MKEKTFKPMKAPQQKGSFEKDKDADFYFSDLKYPLLASYKLDGIRCEFKKGEILSCSLKQIQNRQLREKFEPIRKFCEENNMADGEIYNHDLPFPLISSCVMTQDHNDKKAIKAWDEKCKDYGIVMTREEAVEGMQFWCFDGVKMTGANFDEPFGQRYNNYVSNWWENFPDLMHKVKHIVVNNAQEVEVLFEQALADGYEGLILRDPYGKYKFGRGTLKEGIIYKVKPYRTFDAQIIDVIQATVVNPNAEKKTNELGRSVTSKKKEDRILIEMACDFVVMYEGKEVKPSLAGHTHKQKKEVWKNRESYIGRWIQYKGMLVGAKDVPRHPQFEHYREDKD